MDWKGYLIAAWKISYLFERVSCLKHDFMLWVSRFRKFLVCSQKREKLGVKDILRHWLRNKRHHPLKMSVKALVWFRWSWSHLNFFSKWFLPPWFVWSLDSAQGKHKAQTHRWGLSTRLTDIRPCANIGGESNWRFSPQIPWPIWDRHIRTALLTWCKTITKGTSLWNPKAVAMMWKNKTVLAILS